ncbi:cell division protein SepF [Companilactobacillus sp.]|jgi:cell division inhibitor SepF|uniref:cell division protein SepF n=1 Tax=Companilactobacillus sp. TaxID=2767905 RepID=UPI0025BB19E6|nr:cell division protein SepF [Companilactobacillus sp.]MCH4008442.1 cell division protein SepF [Companilactobacillus sp.]MCH4051379.1 cell division protein SepF [Companilactobacillus sp.]MCH4076385.1 cell division protein SepF [Companilactobacillus sp.]MCH4124960.1 cell division protein SepF [Companilactobacillus sp.]MCH4131502.1 cell division protein SepF [Companilactobacillus sp.]
MAFEKLGNFFGISEDDNFEDQQSNQTQTTDSVDYSDNEKVVSIDSGNSTKPASSKIAIYQPRVYADAKVVAKQLLNNKAVIVNFNNINDDQAKRIVDFLTGTVFALNGEIKRVGDKIFLCTPPKFQIDGSIPDIGE